ncbi:unnamed protein product [Caretta caretta]
MTNLAQALPSSGAARPCITWEKHLGRRQPLPHAQGWLCALWTRHWERRTFCSFLSCSATGELLYRPVSDSGQEELMA